MVKYFIAHRGNINGPNPIMENKPEYIIEALKVKINIKLIDIKINQIGDK